MKFVFPLFFALLASPVSAATLVFDLRFEGDAVGELHRGFDRSDICRSRDACFPDNFRLSTGFFSGLEVDDTVTAYVDTAAGTARIGDWTVPGQLVASSLLASFLNSGPTSLVEFGDSTVRVFSEGPSGFNSSGRCDPNVSNPDLPSGFCGFHGYNARFSVESISQIPLPAAALLLLTGLGAFAMARRNRD